MLKISPYGSMVPIDMGPYLSRVEYSPSDTYTTIKYMINHIFYYVSDLIVLKYTLSRMVLILPFCYFH